MAHRPSACPLHRFVLNNPNMWTSLFTIVIDLLVVLFVVNAPFQFHVPRIPGMGLPCFQPWTIGFSMCLAFPFLAVSTM